MLGFHRATSKARKGIQFLKDQVQRHIEEMDYESPPRDYTDSYLIKIKDHENDPSTVFTGKKLCNPAKDITKTN